MSMKRILILGAGLVSRPIVHYLTGLQDTEVTVATRTVSKAEALIAGRPRSKAMALDVIKDATGIEEQIKACDIAVSLLPASEHVRVARLCLKHRRMMATTSYISPEMQTLDADAQAAGLTFINECGVDPGLDHMSAMRVIHAAKANSGRVESFRSYCGGLPAPEANTNPIGYKFSWAPRGVLTAATNPARYRQDGKVVERPGDELFTAPEQVAIEGAGTFEGFPNRDALPYGTMYGLDDAATMFRGTLRNQGHCETWYPWVKLGLFSQTIRPELSGMTYHQFICDIAGDTDPKHGLASKTGLSEDAAFIDRLEWLGMFEDVPIGLEEAGNIDVMAARMREKCPFQPGERDMIVMQHEFVIDYAGKKENRVSSLVEFGIPDGDSAMARTVSLPVAIATRMIVEGKITQRGVIAPIVPEIYNPILDELSGLGIAFKEMVLA
ncbi:saccharopine dehydrogenase [Desulfosarcina ovata subsp. ovata]|uniref:Saccharopine dehydrogenase n=2 Tax=Desulfosarcina ovata TaxID=83564 RepID=A0A5K8AIN5_9BACT|nr:saccharopine dehydrogenase C-terminal domain-containing protein [Desulfosarcina ovata]BBO91614.1 saccharopine dehydrogenase [Desulfosarcina ovata subsp. ovata]